MANISEPIKAFPVRRVPLTRPFIWLQEGWDDLLLHSTASIAYGLLVAILGALILAYSRHPFYIAAVCTAFLLVGPVLTAGCCELSRRQDEGSHADFQDSLTPLSRNRQSLFGIAGSLGLLSLMCFGVAIALFTGLIGSPAPSFESTLWGDVMKQLSYTQLVAYGLVWLVLSALVFALSVVTIPMIIERHVDAATAMKMSIKVTAQSFPVMMVWAALIVGLVYLAFSTHLIGMVLIFPLLAHATWRAYKELVE
jgi:uncharacterized membrane protein